MCPPTPETGPDERHGHECPHTRVHGVFVPAGPRSRMPGVGEPVTLATRFPRTLVCGPHTVPLGVAVTQRVSAGRGPALRGASLPRRRLTGHVSHGSVFPNTFHLCPGRASAAEPAPSLVWVQSEARGLMGAPGASQLVSVGFGFVFCGCWCAAALFLGLSLLGAVSSLTH